MGKNVIIIMEEKLMSAIKIGDVTLLDDMLHDNLVFINQSGTVISKSQDLDMHRSGRMSIHSIDAKDVEINIIGESAVVNLTLSLQGLFDDVPFAGTFKYLRIWQSINGAWKVIAASCVSVSRS